MSLNDLRATWTTLYKHTLPSLAISKSPVQERWPVHIDHCFARIILDAVVGQDAPWTTKLKAPAWKNMSVEQLRTAIDIGQNIARGNVNLTELDDRSLVLRGKTRSGGPGRKRKRDDNEDHVESGNPGKVLEAKPKKSCQSDIRSSMTVLSPDEKCRDKARLPSPSATQAPTDDETSNLITSSGLTPFRQRVLLTLCQVPPGRFTTYAAISEYLKSSPRAVGSALRNNPYAPRVPCHRVMATLAVQRGSNMASGGGIGGFGGELGSQGKHAVEKVRLLKAEGVRVDQKGEKVLGHVWRDFV